MRELGSEREQIADLRPVHSHYPAQTMHLSLDLGRIGRLGLI